MYLTGSKREKRERFLLRLYWGRNWYKYKVSRGSFKSLRHLRLLHGCVEFVDHLVSSWGQTALTSQWSRASVSHRTVKRHEERLEQLQSSPLQTFVRFVSTFRLTRWQTSINTLGKDTLKLVNQRIKCESGVLKTNKDMNLQHGKI